mgnify:CR=1 FL=1
MSTSLRTLKGVGEKTEKLFAKIGVTDMESLLSYYPRNYDAYEEPVEIQSLEEGAVVAISVAVITCVCESGAESSGDHDHCGRSYGENFYYVV